MLTRLAARRARQKDHTRVIYTAHGFHFYKGSPMINWIIYYPIEKWLSKYTDYLITINKEDYDIAKNKFKKAKQIELINGIGVYEKKLNFEMTEKERIEFRRIWGLEKDDFVLIQIGELNKNKNQIMTIEAMKIAIKENPNIKLLLAGTGPLKELYEKKIKEYELEKNILLLGFRNDVPKLLKIVDCLISTSKREGLPVNVIEAQISGVPVIATNCRGNRDLTLQENLVEIGDIQELALKIVKKSKNKKDMNKDIVNSIEKYYLDNILDIFKKKIYIERKEEE